MFAIHLKLFEETFWRQMCLSAHLRPRNDIGILADELTSEGDLISAAVMRLQAMGPMQGKLTMGEEESLIKEELGLTSLFLGLPGTCRNLDRRETTFMLVGTPGLIYRSTFTFDLNELSIRVEKIEPEEKFIYRIDRADEGKLLEMLTNVLVRFGTLAKHLTPEIYTHPNFQRWLRGYDRAHQIINRDDVDFMQKKPA